MCKCLPRSTITTTGIILTIVMGLISIPCIVLSGVDYQQTDMRWTSVGSWFRTGPLKVGCIVVVFASVILGLAIFICAPKSKPMQAFFVVVNGLSALLTLAVSIFVLVASSMSETTATRACTDPTSGLFEYFKELQLYFSKANEELCTLKCPCRFTNTSAIEDFQQNPNYFYDFANYETTNNKKDGAIQIQNCPGSVTRIIKAVNEDANFIENIGNQTDNFQQFADYWGRIEQSFKCTGWCQNNYLETDGSVKYYYKYLFSDINQGPVRNTCMAPVIKWIKKTLKAYGGLGIIISVIQGILFALALSLLADLTGDSKSQRNDIELD